MALKVTLIFQATTSPTDPSSAIPHTGGWSESFWLPGSAFVTPASLQPLMNARANILPFGAAIIGVRQGLYDISGNKLLPRGTSAFKKLTPGNSAFAADLPQVALEWSGTSSSSINSNRFTTRGAPDSMMQNGEWQPSAAQKALCTIFRNALLKTAPLFILGPWGFVGRDLTQPSGAVNSIAGNVVTLRVNVGGLANQDYLRFHRVIDDNKRPVKGSYLITAINGNAYTLAGLAGFVLTRPSGTARVDRIALFEFGTITPSRAVVKKIGRPLQGYRGRQSNRT